MSQEIEIEFKNLLLEEEFQKLCHYFQIEEKDFFAQTNHYFDTPDFILKNLGSALRIREKNGQCELTLKEPHDVGLLETNQPLTKDEADLLFTGTFPDGQVKDVLLAKHFPIDKLQCFGTLTTKRAEKQYKSGTIVLDESSYLNKKDYEIEYEVSNFTIGKEEFFRLLTEKNIPIRKTANKIKRLYETKFSNQ